jgi:hypothetical protein
MQRRSFVRSHTYAALVMVASMLASPLAVAQQAPSAGNTTPDPKMAASDPQHPDDSRNAEGAKKQPTQGLPAGLGAQTDSSWNSNRAKQ